MDLKTQWKHGLYEFQTEAGGRGQGKEIRVVVPPHAQRALKILVDNIPEYEHMADVMRDAFMHWLEEIKDVLKNPEDCLQLHKVSEQGRLVKTRQKREEWNEALDEAKISLREAYRVEDYALMAHELIELYDMRSCPISYAQRANKMINDYERVLPEEYMEMALHERSERIKARNKIIGDIDWSVGSEYE